MSNQNKTLNQVAACTDALRFEAEDILEQVQEMKKAIKDNTYRVRGDLTVRGDAGADMALSLLKSKAKLARYTKSLNELVAELNGLLES